MGCSVGGIESRNLLTVTEEKSTEGGRSLIRKGCLDVGQVLVLPSFRGEGSRSESGKARQGKGGRMQGGEDKGAGQKKVEASR